MKKNNIFILITGHRGFIGSNFIKYLNSRKIEYEIFNNSIFKNKNKRKFTHIFHFAYRKSLKNISVQKYINDNVVFTKKIIMFAKKNGSQLIFPSTACYFPSNQKHKENDKLFSYNLYSFTKILCEKMILNTKKLNYIIFRIFNVYGKDGKSFLDVLKKKVIRKKNFTFKENSWIVRDFISIKDIFKIFEIVIVKKIPNDIYNLAAGKSYQLEKIAKKINKLRFIKFSNNVKFTPYRPIVRSNINKLKKKFKYQPNKNIYSYFNE